MASFSGGIHYGQRDCLKVTPNDLRPKQTQRTNPDYARADRPTILIRTAKNLCSFGAFK
jgi:hypothetical protein